MCVGNENKSISDSDLRNTLINSIMKLSKDKQKSVLLHFPFHTTNP